MGSALAGLDSASARNPLATPAYEKQRSAKKLPEEIRPADTVELSSLYREASVRTEIGFSATRVSLASDGAQAEFEQLEFSFFRESRVSELVTFQRRAAETAEQAPEGSRESYLATSERVAAQFEMSFNLTGEALAGFSNASGELASEEDLFSKLVQWANDLLSKSDELFQEFFAALSGGEGANFQNFFTKLQDTFTQALGLLGEGTAPASGGTAGAGTVQMEFNFSFSFSASVESTTVVQQSDPITLDLDDDGIELSSYEQGARFDILGNGKQQTTAFVTGGDAFLALDRNGNGAIDSGKELFGDQNGAANGYEELRKLDDNGDGVIDAKDKAFDSLLLFRDNGDGKTDDGELISLKDAGISSISLGYKNVDLAAAGGNRLAQIASFTRSNGVQGRAADAILNYIA